jgi:cellulose biosynthesis protein BcsQ
MVEDLLVDFDPQGALSAGLGVVASDIPTVFDIMVKKSPRLKMIGVNRFDARPFACQHRPFGC